jgi:integrase
MRPRMGRHATGSVDYKAGRWRARVTIEGRQQTLGTYPTEIDAAAAIKALHALSRGSTSERTVNGYGRDWLLRREASGKYRNAGDDIKRWNRHVGHDPIGQIPLRSLERGDVIAWVAQLGTRLRARQSVRNCLGLLRNCLQSALDEGLVKVNHARLVKVPPHPHETEEKWTFLELHEIADCTTKPPPHRRQIYTVAIYTGLRKSELWGLLWTDVKADHIVVRHSGRTITKSGRIRRVPLLRPAREAFAQMRKTDGLVWPRADGKPHDKWWSAGWAKWAPKREPRVRFHDLRHTCASHLVMGSWGRAFSLSEVKEWLGHSDIAVTQRYAHLAPGALLQSVAMLEGPGAAR